MGSILTLIGVCVTGVRAKRGVNEEKPGLTDLEGRRIWFAVVTPAKKKTS